MILNMKLFFLCPIFVANLCIFSMLHGQIGYRSYRTNSYNLEAASKNEAISLVRYRMDSSFIANRNKTIEESPMTISLVFHILLANPSIVTNEMLNQQIDMLNQGFSQITPLDDFLSKNLSFTNENISKPNLTFCIASGSSDNKEEALIFRKAINKSKLNDLDIKDVEYGGSAVIDPDRMVNIWIVDLENDDAGYAQWPGGNLELDGIVLDYDYLIGGKQKKYNLGKSLIHLMGSYFGLYELWGQREGECSDDLLEDTPIHNAANFTPTPYAHYSTCHPSNIELINNYMDNTDDRYTNHFTKDQTSRIRFMLSEKGERKQLVNGGNCVDNVVIDHHTDKRNKESTSVYPNPFSGKFILKTSEETQASDMIITNEDHHNVAPISINFIQKGEFEIDLSNCENGVYFLRIITNTRFVGFHKLVLIK